MGGLSSLLPVKNGCLSSRTISDIIPVRVGVGFGRLLTAWWGFRDSSVGKESACNAGDLGSIPGLGRSPGEGTGYLPQSSGLENSMDYIVHGVAKSRTRLSDFHLQPGDS